jgi:hypothetical protein
VPADHENSSLVRQSSHHTYTPTHVDRRNRSHCPLDHSTSASQSSSSLDIPGYFSVHFTAFLCGRLA